jgi:acyl carrier protein
VNSAGACNAARHGFDKTIFFEYRYAAKKRGRNDMDKMDIQEKIVAILAKHTSVNEAALTPDKDLKLDLGLDSLDVAEIVYEMEEAFDITITDESAERIRKISDTVDFVHEKMTESARDGLSTQER